MDKRYRVVPPLQGIQPASVLVDRLYTEIPADEPDHPTCYEGEWMCEHSLCPVRMVQLRVKALFHQHLPRLRCPLCLRALTFCHWLSIIALQEVPAEGGAVAPRRRSDSRSESATLPKVRRKRTPRKSLPKTAAPSM